MQTLFTSDRMIVKWVQYHWPCETEFKIEPEKYIELEFIFQVNWKLTQHRIDMELEKDWLSLKNYNQWNAICRLFFDMWYKFEEWLYEYTWIIEQWLLEANRWRD